ncbi:hypothetical protein [Paenibacillus xylaniclasticus]|uniref:hypothetical protein n=1 Tax=Paenibacillus xylaniclasticus TaxID=588083 RepID=UPI000FD77EBC|nr:MULTISPECIES: hypothetical protein [Paenibacillus]GFN31070.1 hypothetical protein PCURB6_13300 [Paenibacillus curdlanolyticus]
MLEREWTEKEPVMSEWTHQNETKKEPLNADQPPKLSMKLLYGMIQELKQYSERLSARLDEFEVYLIQVQAARAQLEANAASTIAKTKLSETIVQSSQDAKAAAAPNAASDQEQLAAASEGNSSSQVTAESVDAVDAVDAVAVERAYPQPDSSSVEPTASFAADEPVERQEVASPVPIIPAVIEAAPGTEVQPSGSIKPISHETGSADLMTLAMEVMGLMDDEDDDEDGLDPGEGVNPFNPDRYVSSSLANAAADARPERFANTSSLGSDLSSPFFTPRSQRHQGKKKFLNLFGFRTRIS